MEKERKDRFAKFYAEYADTYADDMELALKDFTEYENMDNYGFLDGVKAVGNMAASGAAKVGSTVAKTATSAVKKVGSNVGKYAGRAAIGAGVGMAVQAARGKSLTKGAIGGAAGGLAAGAVGSKVASGASNLYNKAKQQFSDLSEDPKARDFVSFYSDMEDIYELDLDEAYADYSTLFEGDNMYSNKTIAKGALIGTAAGVGLGYGAHKLQQKVDRKRVAKLEAKLAKGDKLNIFSQARLDNSRNRLSHPKATKAANMIGMGLNGAIAGSAVGNYVANKKKSKNTVNTKLLK